MIEQQIPVPILCCMGEIKHNGDANGGNSIEFSGYLRDNLHLASQSKVRCDNKTQSTILRNKPLVLFVGSSQVKGKSSILEKLYPNQQFNVCNNKSNPLHNTSVDLVFLPQRHNVNYHLLDVHGAINDSYFSLCSNNGASSVSKMDCLVGLSSLCQVVVVQITMSQLAKSPKMKKFLNNGKIPKTKFTMDKVVSGKTAADAVYFQKRIQVKLEILNFPSK